MSAGARRVAHLVSRFVSSLHPRSIDAQTLAWVRSSLGAGELRVWEAMAVADRVESVAVARRFERGVAGTPLQGDVRWRAAALLHDVGKQASGYGPVGRALATVVAAVAGNDRARGWANAGGRVRARIGWYVAHDDIGGELLEAAGARPEAVAWAGAHHRLARWDETAMPPEVCAALAEADGEPPPRTG